MAKMGRPKVDKPKDYKVGIRLSDDEYARLKRYAEIHNRRSCERKLIISFLKILSF